MNIQNIVLPPLSGTVVEIQQVCANPNSSLFDVSKIIERDPLLMANILRYANSPIYGHSQEITNINTAVALFGLSTIFGFVVSSVIKSSFKIKLNIYKITEEQFINGAISRSLFANRWYSKIDKNMTDLISQALFLCEIGKIVIAQEIEKKGITNRFMDLSETIAFCDVERELLGYSSYELSGSIFKQWKFDKSLINIINQIDYKDEVCSCFITKELSAVKLILKLISLNSKIDENGIESALELCKLYGFDVELFKSVLKEFLKKTTLN